MAKKAKYQEYKLKDGTIGGVWCAELQMGIPKDENNVDWQENHHRIRNDLQARQVVSDTLRWIFYMPENDSTHSLLD